MAAIFSCALLCVIMQIRYLYYFKEGLDSGCWLAIPFDVAFPYWLSFEILKMFAPIVILIVIYALATFELSVHQKNFMAMGMRSAENLKRVRRDRQIVTMFIVIVTIFFLLNAPYSCFIVAVSYYMHFDYESWDPYAGNTANIVLFALSAISSIVNPLVYAKMHMEVAGSLKSCFRRVGKASKGGRIYSFREPGHFRKDTVNAIEMSTKLKTADSDSSIF